MSYYDEYSKYLYGEGGPANRSNNNKDNASYRGPEYNEPSFSPEPPRKKKGSGAKIAAICAACALGGSALGGGIVGLVMARDKNAPQSAQSVDSKSGALASSPTPDQGKFFSIEDATKKISAGKTALSVSEIYKKVSPSIVAISTQATVSNMFGQEMQMEGAGSGVIISQDGYILTNNHVIAGSTTVKVVTSDEKTHDAKVVGADAQSDLAVLKVEASDFTPATFGDSSTLEVGELAVAIGNPLGELANSLTVGNISALSRTVTIDGEPMSYLQTSAAISPGNSGGALINSFGEVIGITTAKSTGNGVEGIGFAIPINDAETVAEQLINNGYVTGRAFLGITPNDVDKQVAEAYGLPVGVYVADVVPGSAAEKAGLQKGDIILKFGDKEVKSRDDLEAAKKQYKAGDTVSVSVYRKGDTLDISITLGEQPREEQQTQEQQQQQQQPGQYYGGQEIPKEFYDQLPDIFKW